MGFIDAIKSYYIRYFDFETRSSRSEYWWVQLYFVLLVFTLLILFFMLAGALGSFDADVSGSSTSSSAGDAFAGFLLIVIVIFLIGHIIPSIAVTVRRFHDQDKSGWFYLMNFIPYIGGIIIIVFMILEGTRGPNRFGEDPLEDALYDTFD